MYLLEIQRNITYSINYTTFFLRVTIVTICLVLITFAILSLGISLVLFRNCGQTGHSELNCEVGLHFK